MQTNEFNQAVSSSVLNENMFKKFGVKVNFTKYTREQLEDARNHLRTKLSQTESSAGFNDLLANEDYQQDKYMLNLLNTKIKEMLGERKLTKAEKAKKEKVVKKDLKPKKKEFEKRYGKDKGEQVMYAVATNIAKGKKMNKKTNEAKKAKPDYLDFDGDGDKKEPMKKALKDKKKAPFKKMSEAAKPKCCCKTESKSKCPVHGKKKVKESLTRQYYSMVIESIKHLLTENEEAKAKDISSAADMVSDLTRQMTQLAKMQTTNLISLHDSIRQNFGEAEANAFKEAIEPALEESLEVVTRSRETISRAVQALAGGEIPTPMGADTTGMDGMDDLAALPGDTMNEPPVDDEFAASDAAAGGAETAGREMRESKERARARRLSEEHSIISRLAK
jgi:hypothetical protein